jgi:alkylation response protein AidB-like acyl-CoA dehydrogenase
MIDLSLGDDQRQMLEGASAMLAEHAPVSRLRPGGKAGGIHARLAEWGWFGVGLPEAEGGLGLGVAEEVVLAFEAGRFLLPPSVLATTLAARLCGGSQRAALLTGEARAALALQAPGGTLVFDSADATFVVAFDAGSVTLARAAGFDSAVIAGVDETVDTRRGTLQAASIVAQEAAADGQLLVAAMLAGIARATCDLAVEYAGVREQFGRPIGAFQAVKHICADMGLRSYASEAQVKMAAAAAADAPGIATREIAAACLTALRAAIANAEDAIQVHGGIGFTAACDAHVYLKRAHLLGAMLGGLEACRARVLAP